MAEPITHPDFAFRDGHLWITDAHTTLWLRAWPDPEAQGTTPLGAWAPLRPTFRLVQPEPLESSAARDLEHRLWACDSTEGLDAQAIASKQTAYAHLRQTLLPEHAQLIEGFTCHQWNVLHLLHERPAFIDLLRANPVLAWCVANNDLFRKLSATSPAFQARWHVHKKQRELLDWLGFPGGEKLVKLFKKFSPALAVPRSLGLLQTAVQEHVPVILALAHLPRINFGALYLVTDRRLRDVVTPGLLAEVAATSEEETDSPTAGLLTDALHMLQQLDPDYRCPPLDSIQAIARLHDRAVTEFNRPPQLRQTNPTLPFPPPPLSGTASIVPLTTLKDLQEEGRRQSNCVGSYEAAVRCGACYIYRVLKPARATLSITHSANGWHIQSLLGHANCKVKPATVLHVQKWLHWANTEANRPKLEQKLDDQNR